MLSSNHIVESEFAPEVGQGIAEFLRVASPSAWAHAAAGDLEILLNDHANCEYKAASTALALIHRYPFNSLLVQKMSRLAREELRHFEQVSKIMGQRGFERRTISASRYAAGLRAAVSKAEPQRLIDTLIVGALIEARSCERFALIAPLLDDELARFYRGLLASEARHFEGYILLANKAAGDSPVVAERVKYLRGVENELITSVDSQLRFHSGVPA